MFNKKSKLPNRRQTQFNKSSASDDVFRRNRTLSGTTSNNLKSVNIVKSGLESPRTNVHHLAIRRRKVFSTLLFILLSILFIWLLISNFTATPLIVVTDKSISKNIESPRYTKVIQDYLQINPMGRFSFLLDQDALSKYVSNKLPEVFSVRLQGMDTIGKTVFIIKMRQPVAGWMINNKQYYVDSKGVSFDKNYYIDPIIQIIDNSGVPIQTGTTSVSKRLLGFAGRVVSLVSSNGYSITTATLPSGTMRELDINIKEIPSVIKLSLDRPIGEQIEDMSRAVQYFIKNGMSPKYIDVRVSNKAFYI